MKALRLAGGVLLLSASLVWADVPPPDVAGCQGKQAGDACERDDRSAGTCVKATCSRNDYSEGPPPKTVDYECLKCGAAAAAPSPQAPEAPKSSSCAAAPGLSLLALAGWLAARRRR